MAPRKRRVDPNACDFAGAVCANTAPRPEHPSRAGTSPFANCQRTQVGRLSACQYAHMRIFFMRPQAVCNRHIWLCDNRLRLQLGSGLNFKVPLSAHIMR
jgi:hypothetical protein